jgi:hypothetical protein
VPAFLTVNAVIVINGRAEYRVEIDPGQIDKILFVLGRYRIHGLVREGHGVKVGVHGALYEIQEGFLNGIVVGTCQNGVLKDMEYSRVIPGKGLEGCGEEFVLAAVIKPSQPGSGLKMLHFIEGALELF